MLLCNSPSFYLSVSAYANPFRQTFKSELDAEVEALFRALKAVRKEVADRHEMVRRSHPDGCRSRGL